MYLLLVVIHNYGTFCASAGCGWCFYSVPLYVLCEQGIAHMHLRRHQMTMASV